jgi:short-subunit dehydrogenase
MNLKEKYGGTALIAGASEGIGAAFAAVLAAHGMDLVLIARRREPLQRLAGQLTDKYSTNNRCLICDLSLTDATEQIVEELNGHEIDMLVYNAALSYLGPFIKNSVANHVEAARVNMITPLTLVHLFGEKMLARGRGAVILMTSMAGLQGSGYLSLYAATKAFNRILAESLWYEWRSTGVDIIACCAGATSTPGYVNLKPEKPGLLAPRVLTPEEVAEECLQKLERKPSFITGRGNRIASFFMQKVLPRKTAVNIMGDNTRKMYRL